MYCTFTCAAVWTCAPLHAYCANGIHRVAHGRMAIEGARINDEEEYRLGLLQFAAAYRQEHRRMPFMIWRDSSVQHFNTPTGDYSVKGSPPPCMPLGLNLTEDAVRLLPDGSLASPRSDLQACAHHSASPFGPYGFLEFPWWSPVSLTISTGDHSQVPTMSTPEAFTFLLTPPFQISV